MIPKQYKNDEFRFCLVAFPFDGEKRPYGKDCSPDGKAWNSEHNLLSLREIPQFMEWGFGFGILPGYGNLLIIDVDEKSEAENIHNIFQEVYPTFSVKTASDKYHLYYYCEEHLKDKKWSRFRGYELDNKSNLRKKLTPIVEVFSKPSAKQVLTAINNSYEGHSYRVFNDAPIADITHEQIIELLKPYEGLDIDPDKTVEENPVIEKSIHDVDYCFNIEEIVSLDSVLSHYGMSRETFICPTCGNWSMSKKRHHDATAKHPNCIVCMRCEGKDGGNKGWDIWSLTTYHEGDIKTAFRKLCEIGGINLDEYFTIRKEDLMEKKDNLYLCKVWLPKNKEVEYKIENHLWMTEKADLVYMWIPKDKINFEKGYNMNYFKLL